MDKSKTLVFSEKPSVARDIAGVLGASGRHQGYLEGSDFLVTWGVGHLVTLAPPEGQNPNWKRWDLATLPMIPKNWKLVVLPATADQFEVVRSLMNRPDVKDVVNAADAGREGELIFRLVYGLAGCKKPFRRLWISSMTDEAIRCGFSALKSGTDFDPLARAAECRSRADWLVGMNLTRCYTKRFGGDMLTIGRVQTPTLGMVVHRQLEIDNFKPRDYWEIKARFDDFSAQWFDPKEKETPARLWEKSGAEVLARRLQGAIASVKKVTSAKKKQPPPFLYDLTTLQREANSRFGYTAAQTLATAQTLYERKKVITYPRTDSRHLSEDIHSTIGRRLDALPKEFASFVQALKQKPIGKTKRVFDNAKVSDHHAIIPTEQRPGDMQAWKPDERNVYDLVARRFLAAFFPDQEYLSTFVLLDAAGESLKAFGKVILVSGWRALYERKDLGRGGEDDDADSDEQALPPLKQGDAREVKKSELLTKQTKPPAAFTDATLLLAMETAGKLVENEELRLAMKESGLGTPATRAEIIEKLLRVGYLARDKKKLQPTLKGMQLISVADGQLTSPELTGAWEKRLAEMAKGREEQQRFMDDIGSFVINLVNKVKTERTTVRFTPTVKKPLSNATPATRMEAKPAATPRPDSCPKHEQARHDLRIRGEDFKGSAGKGLKQRPVPASAPALKPPSAPALKSPSAPALKPPSAPTRESPPTPALKPPSAPTLKSPSAPTLKSPSAPALTPAPRPTYGVCPACGKGSIIEGSRGYGCNRFREGCSYVVWMEFLGKKLSKTAINQLIAGKPTRVMKGFTTKDGRKVSGKIRMRADGHGIELVEWSGPEGSGGKEPA